MKLHRIIRFATILCFALTLIQEAHAQFRMGVGRRLDNSIKLDYGNPKEYEIAEIDVKGIETLNKSALLSLTGLKVGDKVRIPGDDISNAIRKLWKHGIIGDVSILVNKLEDGQAYLTLQLKERPRLTRFEFDGIGKSQAKELGDKIKLIRGRVLTDAIIKNAELSIRDFYIDKGYLNVNVKTKQIEDTLVTSGVRLKFLVDRKSKVRIDQINVYGADEISAQTVKGKMKKTNENLRFHLPNQLATDLVHVLRPKNLKYWLTHKDTSGVASIKKYLNDNVKMNFFKTTKFIRKDYNEDLKKVVDYYNAKGFRDAQVLEDSVYASGKNRINVDLHIEEGQKYYFRNIDWVGNYVYSDKVMNGILGVKKGDIYDMDLIQKKLTFNPNGKDINGQYMDFGYLAFQCVPVEVRVEGDSIDVEMRIKEGAQFTINKVKVIGNDRTNDHVVYRELRTIPGDKFSREMIIRTQRELSQLGYFDAETISPTPKPNFADETVDIDWGVTERPSDQISLSGGWGGAFGFVGTVGLTFNNFSVKNIFDKSTYRPLPSGDGQKLSLNIQANGVQYQSYSIGFTEPWLGGRKPNSLNVSFNHSIQRIFPFNDFSFKNQIGYLKMWGGSIGLGRRLTWPDDYFTWSNALSVQTYEMDNYDYSRLGFNTGTSTNLSFISTLSRSSVDNPMYPRTGSLLTARLAMTPPYSLFNNKDYDGLSDTEEGRAEKYKFVEFYKINIDLKNYVTVWGDLVLETKAHFGHMGSYSDRVGVGPFERFEMGGSGLSGGNFMLGTDIVSLRGYQDRSLIPFNSDEQIQGGTTFVKYAAELRYPLSLNPSATIYVHTFAEAGNNFNELDNFDPFNVKRSAGVGARIFMPAFGLIGIDWGYGFDTTPTNPNGGPSGSQFHFTIGQQIR
ncbi:BamA/OMP85 family outer membrane protein [Persicobacter psychrovividus]|uniref:Outer membrane protein assembly factor n=1 Tax=Persicobacter psychrovividus TaxID=387638 RepID=A0ABN6L4J5_9BACT|nr:outer membrane protein assembly factor [Persicobacter psychrovividus]